MTNTNAHIAKIRKHINNINNRANKPSQYDDVSLQDLIASLTATRDAMRTAVSMTSKIAA